VSTIKEEQHSRA